MPNTLYPPSAGPRLDPALFRAPPSAFRGAPFWAWNCKLNADTIDRQIGEMKDMGLGGFHVHCRVGLDTEYMGEEFLSLVRHCNQRAKAGGMRLYLYDEDRWPSGSAGGIVTRDPAFRSRFLVFQPSDWTEPQGEEAPMSAAKAIRTGDRTHLARFRVELDAEGFLARYEMAAADCPAAPDIWDAWLEISGPTPWFNNQSYVNTLDSAAMERFVQVTHQRYAQALGEDFGGSIPSIFTDEPQVCHKERLRRPFDREPIILPWTDDFDQTFVAAHGKSMLERLPELLWQLPGGGVSQARYHYHRHVCQRFSQAFCDQIAAWCGDHNLLLTGHMMSEATLFSQTMTMGEAMRPMRDFGLPGIDMLCDRREYSTAKQAQSVAHQMGREGVMSEIYGVTGWDFDFRGHKLAGDWQAALGVTLRVHHLTWMSMAGEAKRDYPACIGAQSPWYREYPLIEDHFARLNTALTRGRPHVRLGVIHPIESLWMHWGVQSQAADMCLELEQHFTDIIRWLLFGLIDFDFLSESMLDGAVDNGRFQVGEMAYDVVLVPGCHTLRRHTLERLEAFRQGGGTVLFAGDPPGYVDALPDTAPARLAAACRQVPFSPTAILNALEPWRDIRVDQTQADGVDDSRIADVETGVGSTNLLYQMRTDGDGRWLFLCHAEKAGNPDIAYTNRYDITLRGEWTPRVHDTLTGDIRACSCSYHQGNTAITWYASFHDSLLLRLEPGRGLESAPPVFRAPRPLGSLPSPEGYTLSEPNALLLDMAEYRFDSEGDWRPREELLRVDNRFREVCGYPLRMEALAQPWTNPHPPAPAHTLHLRFRFWSALALEDTRLAMEELETATVTLNGEVVDARPQGWFVDRCIAALPLPPLAAGENELLVDLPFGEKTNVEWCYLLGKFGVEVRGSRARLTPAPATVEFGDYTVQGLPFYAGNLTYHTTLDCPRAGRLWLEIPQYRGALLRVAVDGRDAGPLAFAPYRLCCGDVTSGGHRIDITVYGNRFNAFGALHNADLGETWHGPNIWRTTGNKWTYEYRLKEQGVLTTPVYWLE